MKELIVGLKDDNKKLITYLSSTFPHLKLNNIYKTKKKKDIRINEVKISKDVIIHANDKIKVYINDDILNGINSKCEMTAISFAGKGQNLDTGIKVIHNAKNTSTRVNSKSISKDGGICTFRSNVDVTKHAHKANLALSCES